MTFGKCFPECTRFGTRGRPLPREPLHRLAFLLHSGKPS
jgi:hypothetical protein